MRVRGLQAPAATLDRDDPEPRPGDPLPPVWHWLYFLPRARTGEIGPGGHPRRGGFLPQRFESQWLRRNMPDPVLDLLRRHGGESVRQFRFRAERALFDTAPFTLAGRRDGIRVLLRARQDGDGAPAMMAEAELSRG